MAAPNIQSNMRPRLRQNNNECVLVPIRNQSSVADTQDLSMSSFISKHAHGSLLDSKIVETLKMNR